MKGIDNNRIKGDQTIVLSIRLKPSTIANLARFLSENDVRVLSAAGLIREALEIMEQNVKVDKFDSERTSLDYLASIGILHSDYTSKRNSKKIAQCLAIENLHLARRITASPQFQRDVAEATRRFNKDMNNDSRDFMPEISDVDLNPPEEGTGEIITLLPKG
jgi:hypothetical protein